MWRFQNLQPPHRYGCTPNVSSDLVFIFIFEKYRLLHILIDINNLFDQINSELEIKAKYTYLCSFIAIKQTRINMWHL